jgi:hypothetical protein
VRASEREMEGERPLMRLDWRLSGEDSPEDEEEDEEDEEEGTGDRDEEGAPAVAVDPKEVREDVEMVVNQL